MSDSRARVRQDDEGLRYTRTAIVLHWAIALLILGNLGLGYFMNGFAQPLRGTIVSLHISSGITVLVLTVIRVAWRLTHPAPPHPEPMRISERHLANVTHFFLYTGMVVMPLLGWAIISAHPPPGSAGAAAIATAPAVQAAPAAQALPPVARPAAKVAPAGQLHRIWGVVPLPLLGPVERVGETPGGIAPQKVLHGEFVTWHGLGGYLMIGLLLLHVAGALKHQIVDRRRELARMGIGRPEPVNVMAE